MKTLSTLVDATLVIEKLRVAVIVSIKHLALQGRQDAEREELHRRVKELEDYVDGRIAVLIKGHPAYPWFSRVLGVGKENIGKVVGGVRVAPEQGWRKNRETEKLELVDLPYADTISSLWAFAGQDVDPETGKAPRREPGQKLTYNSQLRSMCWRLGAALLKAGLRHKCEQCGHLLGVAAIEKAEGKCPKCDSDKFIIVSTTKFSEYYLSQKKRYYERHVNRGWKIVPAAQLPTRKDPKTGKRKKYEPPGVISEGHVHAQALRKMIKLFLGCLWLEWRKALDLPVTKPYAIDKLEHDGYITPESMTDK